MVFPLADDEAADGDGVDIHPLPKDRMFSPWLALRSDLEQAMGPVFKIVHAALVRKGRRPRSDLLDGIHRIVSAIIANLMLLQSAAPGEGIAVGLRNDKLTRYDRDGFRKLPQVIRALQDAGVLHVTGSEFRKRRTTIAPTDSMTRLMAVTSVADIVRVEGEETIQLLARPVRKRIAGIKQPKEPIDYKDTPETNAMRAEMEAINLFIASHKIELEGSPQAPIRLYRLFTLRRPDDAHVFNLHGRLYGGFWMTLKATERHRLRIDGEPVADLDYSSMFPQLAYASLALESPLGDLYAVPGLEQHREGAKAAFSALFSHGSAMKSMPRGLREKLPEGWTASRINTAFAAHHPGLVPLFGKDMALDLMFTESRILLAAMAELREAGIVSLPMHDGMMVKCSRSEEAKRAMAGAAKRITGKVLPVSRKS